VYLVASGTAVIWQSCMCTSEYKPKDVINGRRLFKEARKEGESIELGAMLVEHGRPLTRIKREDED
jgi:hypothetical protein